MSGHSLVSEFQSTQEFEAIDKIVSILEPLDDTSRERVLLFALHRLGIMELKSPKLVLGEGGQESTGKPIESNASEANGRPCFQKTIAELKKEKQPKYATQMAAIVGYYLLVVAPKEQRKAAITVDDLRAYFSKSDFEMPARPGDILPHAEDSGYFEHQGDGQYKLTERGYDLVDRQLPLKRK